jgi:hypothetical protein
MELEKVRMEFELTRLKYLHEENERQRQHEEVMEQLQQQAGPRQVGMGVGHCARSSRLEGGKKRAVVGPAGQGRSKPTLPAWLYIYLLAERG